MDLYANALMMTQMDIGRVQVAMNASLVGNFLLVQNVPKVSISIGQLLAV